MSNDDSIKDVPTKSDEVMSPENSMTTKFIVSASKLNATLTVATIGSVGLMLGFAFGTRRGLAGSNVNGEGVGLAVKALTYATVGWGVVAYGVTKGTMWALDVHNVKEFNEKMTQISRQLRSNKPEKH